MTDKINDPLAATRAIMGQFLQDTQRRSGKQRVIDRPKMVAGKNYYRLFFFPHTITIWDVLRPDLPFTADQIGQEVQLLFIPMLRYFQGGKGGRVVNGLGRTFDCPLFKEWCLMKKEERRGKSRERPQDYFLVNAMDMQSPEEGIRPTLFKGSEWLGERDTSRVQQTYGMYNLIVGYPTPEEIHTASLRDGAVSADDEELQGSAAGLAPIPGYGYDIIGPEGNDIIVIKYKGVVGDNTDVLLLNKAAPGGPIHLRPKFSTKDESKRLCAVVPDNLLTGIKDLLWIPDAFPGFSSDGKHLPVGGDPDAVEKFKQAAAIFASTGRVADTTALEEETRDAGFDVDDEELADPTVTEAALSPVETFSAETATDGTEPPPKKLPALRRGAKVEARDVEVVDGVESVTVFQGTLQAAPHKGVCKVILDEEEQITAKAAEAVRVAREGQNTNVFIFPKEVVIPLEG